MIEPTASSKMLQTQVGDFHDTGNDLARVWRVRNTKIVGSKFAIVEPFNRESKQTITLLPTSDPNITSGRRRAL